MSQEPASQERIKLTPGEKVVLEFILAKSAVVDAPNFDKAKMMKKVRYVVTYPKDAKRRERFLELALGHVDQINAVLSKGYNVLEVERLGVGKDTRYLAIPIINQKEVRAIVFI